jgi:large subunit ribosomal protein L29
VKASELRERNDDELQQMLRERADDLMHFRLQMATGVVENVKAAQNARRDIARIKTLVKQRERNAAQPAGEQS